MILLDGVRLAAHRLPGIRARADAVRAQRGSAPRLVLLAFAGEDGRAPHVRGKLAAARAAGIDVLPLMLPADTDTMAAVKALEETVDAQSPDGVFVQVPYPAHIDGAAVEAAVPVAADVDIMTTARIDAYLSGTDDTPPLTVAAALLLLDAYAVGIAGRRTVLVAEESPFARMFTTALERRGALRPGIVDPHSSALTRMVGEARLLVVAAGRPVLVSTRMLAAGAVAIDAGYYNADGRGDIDASAGVAHLDAFMPVPGGIGPMTVSTLMERVTELAEREQPR
jgi:methylenetetrahydrofolate dehydrogenase (NADP+) / methenyltetrahydrofolate cyclohydrolase